MLCGYHLTYKEFSNFLLNLACSKNVNMGTVMLLGPSGLTPDAGNNHINPGQGGESHDRTVCLRRDRAGGRPCAGAAPPPGLPRAQARDSSQPPSVPARA